jgi:hypothetical protein
MRIKVKLNNIQITKQFEEVQEMFSQRKLKYNELDNEGDIADSTHWSWGKNSKIRNAAKHGNHHSFENSKLRIELRLSSRKIPIQITVNPKIFAALNIRDLAPLGFPDHLI